MAFKSKNQLITDMGLGYQLRDLIETLYTNVSLRQEEVSGTFHRLMYADIDGGGLERTALYDQGADALLEGFIAFCNGKNFGDQGIEIGRNVLSEQSNWGPFVVAFNRITDVHPADSNSHYGIISYSPHSIIVGNYVENIGSTTGDDTEGIYTKAPYSVVGMNVLLNGGEGEAAINIKGVLPSTDPTGGEGHGIVLVGNVIRYTDAFNAAAPGNTSGIKIAEDDIQVLATFVKNANGPGIYTQGSSDPLDNVTISDALIKECGNNDAIVIGCNGKTHRVTDALVVAAPGAAYRVDAQTTATDIIYDNACSDGCNVGWDISPTTADILNVTINGGRTSNTTDDAIVVRTAVVDRLVVVNHEFENIGSEYFDSAVSINSIVFANNTGITKSTTATEITFISFPVPQGKIGSLEVNLKGTDGTDYFHRKLIATLSNPAGTAVKDLETTVHSHTSAGASGWTGVTGVTGGIVRIRIAGASVDWEADINYRAG